MNLRTEFTQIYDENESSFPTEMNVASVCHPNFSLQNLIKKVKLYNKTTEELTQLATILNFITLSATSLSVG